MQFGHTLILLQLTLAMAGAQELENPPWLAPFPGSESSGTFVTATSNESSWSTGASVAEVVEYYEHRLKDANLAFQSNYDGLGTVIRVQVPRRAALVQIRETGAGVAIKTMFVVDVPVPFHSSASGWPDWLNPISGNQYREYGVPHIDAATRRRYLDGYYSAPYTFDQTTGYYKTLLASHGYQVGLQLLTSSETPESERVSLLEGRQSDERIRVFVLGSLPATVAIEIW